MKPPAATTAMLRPPVTPFTTFCLVYSADQGRDRVRIMPEDIHQDFAVAVPAIVCQPELRARPIVPMVGRLALALAQRPVARRGHQGVQQKALESGEVMRAFLRRA